MRLLAERRAPTSASSFVSGLKVNTVILNELAHLSPQMSWLVLVSIARFVAAFSLWRISYWVSFGVYAAHAELIAHFWRAVATADWGRLSIVVALGVLVGFYRRSRAGLFAQQGA